MKALIVIILVFFEIGSWAAVNRHSQNEKIENYFQSNFDDLSQQMAQGEGKKLSVLAELSGCISNDAQSAFSGLVRQSFEKIMTEEKTPVDEIVKNLQREISEDVEVESLCHSSTF